LDELLSNAYFYVLPSDIEGLSIGLLEAMNFGNCVLVSDIEENREVVGEAGCLFQAGNVNDLRDKISRLLVNEDEVKQFRLKAKERARTGFNWEKVTDEMEKLYTITG
jgi:glycosyltransferase involved in cell wall biosynthesis